MRYEVIAMVATSARARRHRSCSRKGIQNRSLEGCRGRPPRRISDRLRLARAESRRRLREQISAGHVAGSPRDREASGRSRAAGRRHRRQLTDAPAKATTRCALNGLPGARSRTESGCALARMELEVARRLPRLRRKRGIPVTASREKIHRRDRNLWHLSHEGGELEDAANAPFARPGR